MVFLKNILSFQFSIFLFYFLGEFLNFTILCLKLILLKNFSFAIAFFISKSSLLFSIYCLFLRGKGLAALWKCACGHADQRASLQANGKEQTFCWGALMSWQFCTILVGAFFREDSSNLLNCACLCFYGASSPRGSLTWVTITCRAG